MEITLKYLTFVVQAANFLKHLQLILVFRLDDLECSGMLNDVRDEYGMLLRHIVDQSVGMLARYCEKLIILATTPFTLCERQDVLRSSLILMINKLCSSSNLDTGLLDLTQRNYAWRSFQVLIDRLVSWESDKGKEMHGLCRHRENLFLFLVARNVESVFIA